MYRPKFIAVLFTILIVLGFTVGPVAAAVPQLTPVPPAPITPVMEQEVLSRTPRFTFSQVPGIYKYKVRVTNDVTKEVVYTYKNIAACIGDNTCWLQPPELLAEFNLSGQNGTYTWEVAAKIGDSWGNYSAPAVFRVLADTMDSTFTYDYNRWKPITGIWSITTTGYLKSLGTLGELSSIAYKRLFSDGFVYEVTMKRKVDTSMNYLYFLGEPDSLTEDGGWMNAYRFAYHNGGWWSLYKIVDGVETPIVNWTESAAIEPYGWNTLTIWRDSPKIYLWINGQYLGAYDDTTFDHAYFGIGFHKDNTATCPLLVDEAYAWHTEIAPYPGP